MNPRTGNLFDKIPAALPEELFEILVDADGLRLERIVSLAHGTPEGCWYDQPDHEWVALLAGGAGLRFEDEDDLRTLRPGDYLFIAARRRHRVEWTDPDGKTVWLALHFSARSAGPADETQEASP